MNDNVKKKIEQMQEWHKSPEYYKTLSCLQAEINQYLTIAKDFMNQYPNMQESLKNKNVRTEIAPDGGLHRGYYCPSLVYDILVGNVKRRKVTQNIPGNDKPYFQYGFDSEDRLLWANRIYNGCVVLKEILIDRGSLIYGIGLDPYGLLQSIVEEQYVDGRLQRYTFVLFWQDGSDYRCAKLYREVYAYDNNAELKRCDISEWLPQGNVYSQRAYRFEAKDGYLANYISTDVFGSNTMVNWDSCSSFKIRIKRKAKYP